MENRFKVSDGTANLLEVLRTFNDAANKIYEYYQRGTADEVDEKAAAEADGKFAPYAPHVEAIRTMLLTEVGNRVTWGLIDGTGTTI